MPTPRMFEYIYLMLSNLTQGLLRDDDDNDYDLDTISTTDREQVEREYDIAIENIFNPIIYALPPMPPRAGEVTFNRKYHQRHEPSHKFLCDRGSKIQGGREGFTPTVPQGRKDDALSCFEALSLTLFDDIQQASHLKLRTFLYNMGNLKGARQNAQREFAVHLDYLENLERMDRVSYMKRFHDDDLNVQVLNISTAASLCFSPISITLPDRTVTVKKRDHYLIHKVHYPKHLSFRSEHIFRNIMLTKTRYSKSAWRSNGTNRWVALCRSSTDTPPPPMVPEKIMYHVASDFNVLMDGMWHPRSQDPVSQESRERRLRHMILAKDNYPGHYMVNLDTQEASFKAAVERYALISFNKNPVLNLSSYYHHPLEQVDWTKQFPLPKTKGKEGDGDDDESYNPSGSSEEGRKEEGEKDNSLEDFVDFDTPEAMKKKKVGVKRKSTRQHLAKIRDREAFLSGSPKDGEGPKAAVRKAKKDLGLDTKVPKITSEMYYDFIKNIGKEKAIEREKIPLPVPNDEKIRVKTWPSFDSKCKDVEGLYFCNNDVFTPHTNDEWFILPSADGTTVKRVYKRWMTDIPGKRKDHQKEWVLRFPSLYHDTKRTQKLSEEEFKRCIRIRTTLKEEKEEGVVNPHIVRVSSFLRNDDGQLMDNILITARGRTLPDEIVMRFRKGIDSTKVVMEKRIEECIVSGDTKDIYTRLVALATSPSEMPLHRSQAEHMVRGVKRKLWKRGGKVGPKGDNLGKQKGNEAENTSTTLNWLMKSTDFTKFTQRFTRERIRTEEIATDYWFVANPGMLDIIGLLATSGGLEVRSLTLYTLCELLIHKVRAKGHENVVARILEL